MTHISEVTVPYCDTDQMGIAYHANYLKYYEMARWELFRQFDLPYKDIEESGFLLPVTHIDIEYFMPAYYDEVLVIETTIASVKGPRVCFEHCTYNSSADLINKAKITVAFVAKDTRRSCRPPLFVAEKLVLMTPHLQKAKAEAVVA